MARVRPRYVPSHNYPATTGPLARSAEELGNAVNALKTDGGGASNTDELANVSTVPGATASDALDYLQTHPPSIGTDDVANQSGVSGATASDALDALAGLVGTAQSTANTAVTAAAAAQSTANIALISQLRLVSLKTANYTAAANDLVPCDTHAAAFTVTLPAVSLNRIVGVFIDGTISPLSFPLTVSPASGAIDGRSSLKLRSQGELVILQSDGTNWRILDWTIPSVLPSLGKLLSPDATYILGASALTDLSGNSHTMTLEASAGFPARGIDGVNNGTFIAQSRVGWSQKVTSSALRTAAALTLECVFRFDGAQIAGETDCYDLVGINAKSAQNDGVHNNQGTLSYNGADLVTFFGGLFAFQENGGSEILAASNQQIGSAEVVHALATRQSDGKTWTFTVNGGDIATTVATTTPTGGGSTDFRIGSCASASGSGVFQGTMFQAGMFKAALTQDQRYWLARMRLGTRGRNWQGQ